MVSIHTAEWSRKGDILLFMPGKEEVEQACMILQKRAPDLMTLPIYAALPFETQCQIFSMTPQGIRKVNKLYSFLQLLRNFKFKHLRNIWITTINFLFSRLLLLLTLLKHQSL